MQDDGQRSRCPDQRRAEEAQWSMRQASRNGARFTRQRRYGAKRGDALMVQVRQKAGTTRGVAVFECNATVIINGECPIRVKSHVPVDPDDAVRRVVVFLPEGKALMIRQHRKFHDARL